MEKVQIIKKRDAIEIIFVSKSFLQQQVRSMVGCLKYLGEGKWSIKKFKQVTFSKKRVAKEVLKVLNSAIANAENNFGLDIDKLMVQEAYVGKSIMMKRMRARARGRAARILKPFSKLTILLREVEEGK